MNAIRWRGWIVAGAIFVLGVAIGGASTGWLGARALRQALRAPLSQEGPVDRAAARIGAELTKDLKLTADESTRVQTVLDQTATNLKTLRVQATTQAAAELRASTRRIAAELPPGKRIEFYRLIARRFERLGFAAPDAPANP